MTRIGWLAVVPVFFLLSVPALAEDDPLEEGRKALQKKDPDTAITFFTKAIRLDPKNAHAYANRAHAYLRTDNASWTKKVPWPTTHRGLERQAGPALLAEQLSVLRPTFGTRQCLGRFLFPVAFSRSHCKIGQKSRASRF